MMHFAVIALFPSLGFIFPANVRELASAMYKSGYSPSEKCDRELLIAAECVGEINHRHNISKSTIYDLPNEKLDTYHYEIATTECLKHSDCTEVKYIRDFYHDATYMVSDVYKRAYGCLDKSQSTLDMTLDVVHLTIVALFPNLGILFPPNVNVINNLIIDSGHNNFSVECGENITFASTCIEKFNADRNFTDFQSFTESSLEEVDKYLDELANNNCLEQYWCENSNLIRELIAHSIRIFKDLKDIECLQQNNGTDLERSTHNCLKHLYSYELSVDVLRKCTTSIIITADCDVSEMEAIRKALDESLTLSTEYRLPSVFSSAVTNYISLLSCIMFLMFHNVMF